MLTVTRNKISIPICWSILKGKLLVRGKKISVILWNVAVMVKSEYRILFLVELVAKSCKSLPFHHIWIIHWSVGQHVSGNFYQLWWTKPTDTNGVLFWCRFCMMPRKFTEPVIKLQNFNSAQKSLTIEISTQKVNIDIQTVEM